jgi:hypothetical protein
LDIVGWHSISGGSSFYCRDENERNNAELSTGTRVVGHSPG